MPITERDIAQAESYLAAGDMAAATPLLERLVELAEEYIDAECHTTDERQYFSFADAFERLAYRRVERDPRELVQVEVPFDRLYAALSFAYINVGDYVSARNALSQAVRWDPMNCAYRLDLAELYRALGDTREWAALSHSVIERASDGRTAARAYANLGQFFLDAHNALAASGCLRVAERLAPHDGRVQDLSARMEKERPEAAEASDEEAMAELAAQGVDPTPSADIAICLLMCASDAAAAGDRNEATRLTVRARGLIGEDACRALIKLIRESDAELARERAEGAAAAGADGAGVAADGDAVAGDAAAGAASDAGAAGEGE